MYIHFRSYLGFCSDVDTWVQLEWMCFQSEYIADCDERRAFISGFTGSAGLLFLQSWILSIVCYDEGYYWNCFMLFCTFFTCYQILASILLLYFIVSQMLKLNDGCMFFPELRQSLSTFKWHFPGLRGHIPGLRGYIKAAS